MLCLLEGLPGFSDLKCEISDLKSLAESISRQLRAWADSLQNTKITGQRYLTDKTRQAEKSARERHEFLENCAESESIRRQNQRGWRKN
jgi:hypothetical protein